MGRDVGKWPGRVKKILTFVPEIMYCPVFLFLKVRPAQYYQRGYVNNIILLKGLLFLKKI